MSEEITNVQTPPAPTATPAGNTEEMAKLKAEFEKTREGLIRDLQQERTKRQELEQRLSPPAPSPEPQKDVSQDELGKVLEPYTAPLRKAVGIIQQQLNEERAKSVLSSKTGKKWEEIEADKGFQEKLTDVARRHKLVGTADDVVARAYRIMELEDLEAREIERVRTVKANSQASIPSGSAPAPVTSNKEYSAEEFEKLPWQEFDRLSKAGNFRKVDGKFVLVPK